MNSSYTLDIKQKNSKRSNKKGYTPTHALVSQDVDVNVSLRIHSSSWECTMRVCLSVLDILLGEKISHPREAIKNYEKLNIYCLHLFLSFSLCLFPFLEDITFLSCVLLS